MTENEISYKIIIKQDSMSKKPHRGEIFVAPSFRAGIKLERKKTAPSFRAGD